MTLGISRDGVQLGTFPAQNYFETPTSQGSVLFVPVSLKPGEVWAHGTNFLRFFDRATEKLFRESESALSSDIRRKLATRANDDKRAVAADAALVKPFFDLFERLFVWFPGEYVVTLMVNAEPGSASFSKQYRFTLYESDSTELKSHMEDYPYGGGLSYNVDRHAGVSIPLLEHAG